MKYLTDEHYAIAENIGLKRSTVYTRVYILGMNPEEACRKPVQRNNSLWHKWGHLALHNGVSRAAFYRRLSKCKIKLTPYEAATIKDMRFKNRG